MREDFRKVVGDRIIRCIGSDESGVLDQAIVMHNSWWSNGLRLTPYDLTIQIQHGLMLGIFSRSNNGLLGFIQGFRICFDALQRNLPWTRTWDGITAQGSFILDEPDGDCLVCVNIVRQKTDRDNGNQQQGEKVLLTPQVLQQYLDSV